jgi:hypothetical protein
MGGACRKYAREMHAFQMTTLNRKDTRNGLLVHRWVDSRWNCEVGCKDVNWIHRARDRDK